MPFQILDDNLQPIDATIEEWSKYSGDTKSPKRQLYKTTTPWGFLSTVFLGDGIHLFETMLFYDGHPDDEVQHSTDTWQEAYAIHKKMEPLLMESLPKENNQ